MLEIGVLEGHSLALWQAYFPEAEIFGIDLEAKTHYDTQRIKTLVANQASRDDLARVIATTGGEFDIIIDDGGHRMEQQQISLGVLFPVLRSGGLYIIEDVHTSFPEFYFGFGVEPDGQNSTYAMIERFRTSRQMRSKYLSDSENDYLTENVSRCDYCEQGWTRSALVACWKK